MLPPIVDLCASRRNANQRSFDSVRAHQNGKKTEILQSDPDLGQSEKDNSRRSNELDPLERPDFLRFAR